jgi:hypothetical protein
MNINGDAPWMRPARPLIDWQELLRKSRHGTVLLATLDQMSTQLCAEFPENVQKQSRRNQTEKAQKPDASQEVKLAETFIDSNRVSDRPK